MASPLGGSKMTGEESRPKDALTVPKSIRNLPVYDTYYIKYLFYITVLGRLIRATNSGPLIDIIKAGYN